MDQEACSPVSLPHAGLPKGQPYPCLWPTLSPSLRRRLGQEWDGEVLRNPRPITREEGVGTKHFKDFLLLCLGHPREVLTHPQPLVAPEPQSSRRDHGRTLQVAGVP